MFKRDIPELLLVPAIAIEPVVRLRRPLAPSSLTAARIASARLPRNRPDRPAPAAARAGGTQRRTFDIASWSVLSETPIQNEGI